MKEVYLHKYDMPKSCVDCDFREDTNCKAQRIDDGEYVSCHQSKSRMKDGKPITCPLKCIESGELCNREEVRKETAREILQMLIGHEMRDKGAHMAWVIVKQDVAFIAEKYGIELFGKTEQVENFDKLEEKQ